MQADSLQQALQEFSATLTANFAVAVANPAQAEDQLKGPMQTLLKRAGAAFGLDTVARTEATTVQGVRPDVGVSVNELLAGHVELKAPGKGATPKEFADPHDKEQFKRLADHPNLVYSDGNEWALYRRGTLVGKVVRADGDVRTDGAATYGASSSSALAGLLRDFLLWEPIVPNNPKALAEALAPLTRLLREAVRLSLAEPASALSHLAEDWREFFFPQADDAQFADAYAQTLTYALLLARVEGETDLRAHAADRLDDRHALLAQVLRVLAEPAARQEVEAPVGLLERAIAAVDPTELVKRAQDRDVWLYFYEDFLAVYDPKLRKQRGVYFTPPPVVEAQIALVSELLRDRFGKELGFAHDDVVVLDPAVGTGTYLLAAMNEGLDRVSETYGAGAVASRASLIAESFHGFELLIGSYAVAHLRFAQQVLQAEGQLPADGTHIYLTDTLESPYLAPPGFAHAPLFLAKLGEESERARRVKAEVPVLVCLGNPPYFRQVIEAGEEGVERQGGWIRRGDEGEEGVLRDFLRDAPGVHAKNLYNLYVYFWRWALWKVFEQGPGRGVVSFITASSYLRGPGFTGMRRFMRETFDELWVLDLGGDNRGARTSENVFAIQTPVAIAVGVRYETPDPATPARVRYARLDGTQEQKFDRLRSIEGFGNVEWRDCFSGWLQPFLPESQGDFFGWPALTGIFPWQHSGAQWKRTWPIAPDRETLVTRWRALISAPKEKRAALFHETRDRKISKAYRSLPDGEPLDRIDELDTAAASPATVPYAYRTLDRQYCLADGRLGDFPRPSLWRTDSARQLFMTSLLTGLLGSGSAVNATHLVPDLHHFRGSFGAKDVIPLWRDAACKQPNITEGVLDALTSTLGEQIEPEDLFAYCYALLSAPDYVERFLEELEVPGPRVPITRDLELFRTAVGLGRQLVWLHTFGERFVPSGVRVGQIPKGTAECIKAVPATREGYPKRHSYDASSLELRVGDGVFAPVSPAVRGYSVSGLDVIGSWLDYRMKGGAGRRSSELDAIRPETWPPAFTEELVRLLWVIEHTVALMPELNETLAAVIAGPCFLASGLPESTEAEGAAPA